VDDGWRIPDPLWERIEPLLPKRHRHRKGGRPPLPWRPVQDGIFFVLRTGCQWKALPKAFGSASSVHRYFQSLVRRRLFGKLWRLALEEYDQRQGIDWEWQAIDGCMTKAPLESSSVALARGAQVFLNGHATSWSSLGNTL
jgi:transposase